MMLRTKDAAAVAAVGAAATVTDAAARHTVQRVLLPHNSLFVMGFATNARWMHSMHTDKRPEEVRKRPRIRPSAARASA
jgi:hypothetical protein